MSYNEKIADFNQNIRASRQISRNTINRLIVLSSAIVAFSVSFFSIPEFQSSLNLIRLSRSWYLFLATIIVGSLILFLSARLRYAKTWKGIQTTDFLRSINDYSVKESMYAWLIVLWTLCHPANLIFNKPTTDEKTRRMHECVNMLVVHRIARMEHWLISLLENMLLVLFVLALICLVASFNI
jgi:hypothetical protein